MFKTSKKSNVYFIGIGGISMSAIAVILKNKGHIVSGSDMSENEEVKKLINKGIKVNIGHAKSNITDDIDIVVYSKAIHNDNPEMIKANELNIKLLSRSEILGDIMKDYKNTICVAGTHGKTTTTACVAKVLIDKNIDPTINIGGIVDEIGGNVNIGKNDDIFVAEACEYTNSFLDFFPNYEIITNIEEDHLDFFKDINDIRNSYKKFIDNISDGGLLVINNDIESVKELYSGKNIKVITYGKNNHADYYIGDITYDDSNYMVYDIFKSNEKIITMRQKMIGEHNALNVLAAFALLLNMGFDEEEIKKSLMDFKGAKRRLEIKSDKLGYRFIDDYAHHPSEIEASLNAIKRLKYNNLYVIFQPHTFTRTKALFSDFVRVLDGDFNLILAKIYPARELDTGIISSMDLKNAINENKANINNICEYFETFKDIHEYVLINAKRGDLIVTMGAGDVYKIYDMF